MILSAVIRGKQAGITGASTPSLSSRLRDMAQDCATKLHDAVIRVYDDTGNVIETHEHAGEFKEP